MNEYAVDDEDVDPLIDYEHLEPEAKCDNQLEFAEHSSIFAEHSVDSEWHSFRHQETGVKK